MKLNNEECSMTQTSIPRRKSPQGIEENFHPPYRSKLQENNTSINNTRLNTTSIIIIAQLTLRVNVLRNGGCFMTKAR